jgi:acyl-CoA hydrolase
MMRSLDADQSSAISALQHSSTPCTRRPEFSLMKAISLEEAVAMIPVGASVMVGGFMGVGTPERLLDEVVRRRAACRDLQ